MAKPTLPRPTDAELAILRVLWDRGPSTVRQVHDVLVARPARRLHDRAEAAADHDRKGAGPARRRDRTHVYQARLSEEQTQRQLVRDLLDRAFGGSATKLVMQALAARRATPEELGEIRRLLDGRRQGRRIPISIRTRRRRDGAAPTNAEEDDDERD